MNMRTGWGRFNLYDVENGAEVLEALASKTRMCCFQNIHYAGNGEGLALLKQIKQRHPMLPVIIMTAHSRSGCCRQRLSTRGI
ncbi:hypothetical protein ACNKHL_23675 [Shigella flexneri]